MRRSLQNNVAATKGQPTEAYSGVRAGSGSALAVLLQLLGDRKWCSWQVGWGTGLVDQNVHLVIQLDDPNGRTSFSFTRKHNEVIGDDDVVNSAAWTKPPHDRL